MDILWVAKYRKCLPVPNACLSSYSGHHHRTLMAARGGVCDGPISRFVHNVIVYVCTKFGAFITKCTIVQLCRPTSSMNLSGTGGGVVKLCGLKSRGPSFHVS